MLSCVLNINFANVQNDGFADAHDSYDLWVLDPLYFPRDDKKLSWEEILASTNTLLGILDGREYILDCPNGSQFTKKRNVPVVAITNELSPSLLYDKSFQDLFIRLNLSGRIESLCEERLIATFLGCIKRRLHQKGVTWSNAKKILIDYNEETARIHGSIDISFAKQMRRELSEYNLGSLILEGLLKTSKNQIALISVARNLRKQELRTESGLQLIAHMHAEQLSFGEQVKGILSTL
ncbi:unnamed protein product (mitochondrion) [Musa textilis]